MGPPHEGSIQRPIAPWANALTTELHLAPGYCTRPTPMAKGDEAATKAGHQTTRDHDVLSESDVPGAGDGGEVELLVVVHPHLGRTARVPETTTQHINTGVRRSDRFYLTTQNRNTGVRRLDRFYLTTQNINTGVSRSDMFYLTTQNINTGVSRSHSGQVLFNNTLNTFNLPLYGVRHVVKDRSDSERGNPLPPHGLLFLISSEGSFICIIPQTG